MKRVMHPGTKEIVFIDERKEPDRQTKYLHRTGAQFEVTQPKDDSLESLDLERLTELYELKHEKPVSLRYKNDKARIISKL